MFPADFKTSTINTKLAVLICDRGFNYSLDGYRHDFTLHVPVKSQQGALLSY